jgi:lipid II:glycine glycyltransferase (peptidoglycan interpeptide bridge formation enzyme)
MTRGIQPVAELEGRPRPDVLDEWDRLVERSRANDVAQLSTWAQIRGTSGYRPLYLFVRERGELLGGAQILCRRLPGFGTIGYLSHGPLVDPAAERTQIGPMVAAELAALARRLRMLFVQPPVGADDLSEALRRCGFRPSEARIAPTASIRVDVTPSEADLRRNLSRRLRTWTRQLEKRGVTVRAGTSDDIALLARFAQDTAQHHRFTSFSEEYLGLLYGRLADRGRAVILVGEVHGKAVAADLLTMCGEVVTARLGGFDRDSDAVQLNVASAITWESIRWAKAHGYQAFDFGGLRPAAVAALEADPAFDVSQLDGPDYYKTKFGGQLVRYPEAVELISAPVVRVLYDISRRSSTGQRLLDVARSALRSSRATGNRSVPDIRVARSA